LIDEFDFTFSGRIIFGPGSRHKLSKILEENRYESACVVIDEGIVKLDIIRDLLKSLPCSDVTEVVCDISEPTYEKLEEKRIPSETKIDVFIGIGGGSALDMAKALSVLYTNLGPALSYRGFEQFDQPVMPILALPSTAGTGSEITPNASFIDSESKKKMGINGEAIRPKYGILDPELTLSCPRGPTISAAVDSMVHATEAFVAKKTNPMARLFASEGFSKTFSALPRLMENLHSVSARSDVMYGAFLSAVALMNSGTGPAAALSYPLGVHFGVPHGLGGAIFLPEVVDHNINNEAAHYSELLLESSRRETSGSWNDTVFLHELRELWSLLEIPTNLTKYGVSLSDEELILRDTLELGGALEQNPVSFGESEIRSVLKKLIV
jgi:alcohol dehydrogenase class IV